MAITWNNVNAPNNASYIQQRANAGQGVANAFKDVGSLFNQVQKERDVAATNDTISRLQALSANQLRNVQTSDPAVNTARTQLLRSLEKQANVDTNNRFRQTGQDQTQAQRAIENENYLKNQAIQSRRVDLEETRAEDKRNADFIKQGQEADLNTAQIAEAKASNELKKSARYSAGYDGRLAGTYNANGDLLKPDAKQNTVLREAQNSVDRNSTTLSLLNEAIALGGDTEIDGSDTSTGKAISGSFDNLFPTLGADQQRLEGVLEGLETQASLINSEFTKGAISDVEFKAFGEAFGKLKATNVTWETKVKAIRTLQGLVGKANESANFTLTGKRPVKAADRTSIYKKYGV